MFGPFVQYQAAAGSSLNGLNTSMLVVSLVLLPLGTVVMGLAVVGGGLGRIVKLVV